MAKLVVMYTKPEDAAGFEEHYRNVHLPIAQKVPGASWELTRWTTTPRGGEPPYWLMAEATFASEQDMQSALQGTEMREAGMDAAQMVRQFGNEAVMLVGEPYV